TIPLSDASGERSFSVLKRIKNHLRSTMGEQKLNNLAVLYIEQEIMNSVDMPKLLMNLQEVKLGRNLFEKNVVCRLLFSNDLF
ncbi:hypothetical protein HELRODRAFT_62217, partial [Helobdella robusta]|uniref:HAT C-terminal dimerisation domain-containing protein n=1 Tax=Helobdella robusta TaxID=6412 RepID=T1FWX1_HELRO